MLRIALCDDEAGQRQATGRLLSGYMAQHHLAARVREFASGRELLNAVEETGPFDLYILDIVMPEMNGIDLGLLLRQTDREGAILYLTSSLDFALESYQVRAFYYLLKPVEEGRLFGLLDEVVDTLRKKREGGVQVKSHGGTVRLFFDSILYAELMSRTVRYHLRDGGFVDSMTLTGSFREAVSPLLEDPRFLLCGASFIVNLYYVKIVDKNGAVLSDGSSLGLPKAACSALRAAWSDYWLEGGTGNA